MRQDYAKHRRVAEALYEHTRRAATESGLPVVEVNGAQQRGRTFGARLANAFADAFAEGFDRVIAVGSDCPTLHEVDWSAVVARLEEGAPVLGPTSDAEGTYLIGLARAQFDRKAFAALPWKSPALFSVLHCHLSDEAGTAPVVLTTRDDVNGHEELLALLHRSPSLSGPLLARLRQVLGDAERPARSERAPSTRSVLERRSRAPPSVRRSSRA